MRRDALTIPRSITGRFLAAAALLMAVLLGAAGCAFFVPQINGPYSSLTAGVNIDGVGPLAIRNVIIVANDDGSAGNLIAAIVNNTDDDLILHVRIGEGSGTEIDILAPAESTLSFGQRDILEDPPLIEGLDALPGSMVLTSFQTSSDESVQRYVPVLDGCMLYLEGLEPHEIDVRGLAPAPSAANPCG